MNDIKGHFALYIIKNKKFCVLFIKWKLHGKVSRRTKIICCHNYSLSVCFTLVKESVAKFNAIKTSLKRTLK